MMKRKPEENEHLNNATNSKRHKVFPTSTCGDLNSAVSNLNNKSNNTLLVGTSLVSRAYAIESSKPKIPVVGNLQLECRITKENVIDDPAELKARLTRSGIVRVLADTKIDDDQKIINKAELTKSIQNLMSTLRNAPKAAPKTFTLSSQSNAVSIQEMKEFSSWWCVALSSYLFDPACKQMHSEIRALISDMIAALITNRSILMYVVDNFIHILSQIVVTPNNRHFSATLEYKLFYPTETNPGRDVCLNYRIPICENNEHGSVHIFEILLPIVFKMKPQQVQLYYELLDRAWSRFQFTDKYCLLNYFHIPNDIFFERESSIYRFVCKVLMDSMQDLNDNEFYLLERFCKRFVQSIPLLSDDVKSKILCSLSISAFFQPNGQKCVRDRQQSLLFQVLTSLSSNYAISKQLDSIKNWGVRNYLNQFELYHPFKVNVISVDTANYIEYNILQLFDLQLEPNLNDEEPCLNASVLEMSHTGVNMKVSSNRFSPFLDELYSKCLSSTPRIVLNADLLYAVIKQSSPFIKMCNESRDLVQEFVSFEKKWMLNAELVPIIFLDNWSRLALWAVTLSPFLVDKAKMTTLITMVMESLPALCAFYGDHYRLQDNIDDSMRQRTKTIVCLASLNFLDSKDFEKYSVEFPLKGFIPFYNEWCKSLTGTNFSKVLMKNFFNVITTPIVRDMEGGFVISLVDKMMVDFKEETFLTLLKLIGEFWWPMRSISFLKILNFVTQVVWMKWWTFTELEERAEAVAKAIVRLPCIYSNRRKLVKGTGNISHLHTLRGCRTCHFEDDGGNITDLNILSTIVKLAKFLIDNGGEQGSADILDLLVTVNNHRSVPVNFLPKLLPLVKLSDGKILFKLFKVVASLAQDKETITYKPPSLARADILKTFGDTLRRHVLLQESAQDKFTASALIVHHMREVVEFADVPLMLEFIKLSLHLTAICMKEDMAYSCAKTWALFTKKYQYTVVESVCKHRDLITQTLVESIADHVYSDLKSEWKLGTIKVSQYMAHIETVLSNPRSTVLKYCVPAMLNLVVPGIQKCPKKQFLIIALAEYSKDSVAKLLTKHISTFYPYMVFNGDFDSCAKYLKVEYLFDIHSIAPDHIRDIITELMCHMYKNKEKLVIAFGHVLRWESKTKDCPPSMVAVQNVISGNIWNIFTHFSTKLTSKYVSQEIKRKIILAFAEVICLMGTAVVSQHKTKIYAALIALFSLGPKYYDVQTSLWRQYMLNLDDNSLSHMCTQVAAAILTFHATHPEETAQLFKYLTSKRAEILINCGASLHFLPKYCQQSIPMTRIKNSVENLKKESWLNFFDVIVRGCRHQNMFVRYQSVKALRDLIKQEEDSFINNVLQHCYPSVLKLILCLLTASRDDDVRIKALSAECLGIIGALNPNLFSNNAVISQNWKGPREFTIATPVFIWKYLEELVDIFKESEDNHNFDVAACCIMNVVQEYKIINSPTSSLWKGLSANVRDHIQPLLECKYAIGNKNYAERKVDLPIYENIANYEEWLKTWSLLMINEVKDDTALPIFKANRQLICVNTRLASFIVNYIAFYLVMGGDAQEVKKLIINEIQCIVGLWKPPPPDDHSMTQSAPSAPNELVDLVPILNKSEDYFVQKPVIHKKSGLQKRQDTKAAKDDEEHEIKKYQCTKTVFSIIDHLYKAHRHLCKQHALPAHHPLLTTQPIQFSKPKVQALGTLLHAIEFKALAYAAFQSKSYTRSLLYLEQHVKKHPNELSTSLELLQRIFISLNDMDSAMAVASLRTGKTSFDESIMETMINGKSEEVVSCFESATAQNTNDVMAYEGLIQSYISLDQPSKASILLQHCIQKNLSWTLVLSEAQNACLLKLGDWNSISKNVLDTNRDIRALEMIKEKKTEETYHLSKWNNHIATALLQIKKINYAPAQSIIDVLRIRLLEPFSNVSINGDNSYKAHYTNIIGLHILTEVEQVVDLLKRANVSTSRVDGIRTMLQRWNKRINSVENSEHIFRPILDVRKVLLSIMIDHFSSDPDSTDLLNASVRDCWLFAARHERKHGKLFRCANSVKNALTSQASIECTEILIESAKLQIQKGDKSKALSLLQTALKPLEEPKRKFPRTSSSSYLNVEDKDYEKKLKSKVLLLYAKLCDEMRVADQETNVVNFTKAIKSMKECEKNYFSLACYLDRLLNSDTEEKKFKNTNIQCFIAKNYAESLKYGTKYVYQSLPRLLSIWFDFGTEVCESCGRLNTETCSCCSHERRQDLPKFLDAFADFTQSQSLLYMTRIVDSLVECLPMYIFMTAFSQLVSRLCHSNVEIWHQLAKIIVSIICAHPYQSLWMTMSVAKSSYKMRSTRIKEIFKKCEQKQFKSGSQKRIILDYTTLSEKLINLSNIQVDRKLNRIDLGTYIPGLQKLLASKNFNHVLVPIEQFLFPKLPAVPSQHKNYNAFPETAVYIQSIDPTVYLMSSLQRPKKIVFRGSDGRQYPFMCKPKDDLRKDCKVMEVNNVINLYLKRNNRGLKVRTYAVVPLNEECGLLEWVNNLMGLRPIVNNIYKEKNKGLHSKFLMDKQCDPRDNIEKKRKVYSETFLPAHPPVLSEWFLYNFPNHRSWYQARQNFMKTAAVMSIVGYIFGLGDRHGENIMLDTITGDIVHVDFNCLFLEGENLRFPERVPFRLTQNMVDAMGVCGANGVFRKSCELTLTTIREQKSKIISVLRPFVFDPLVEWGEVSTSSLGSSPGEIQNSKATENLIYIKHRINGTARSQTKVTDTELSVEAHVAYLMEAATNVDNLCQMYIGWAAFI